MTTQDPELSAALGWPGGISDPVLDRKTLLQMVAALRLASRQALEAICGAKLCEVNSMSSRHEMVRLMDEAITALRAALAQQAEPVQVAERERIASQWDGCVTRSLDTFGPVDIGASIRAGELVEAQQAEPDVYGYASRLAVAIWEKHYKDIAPRWKPLDDLMGVLTQIDNMTSGLTRLAQQAERLVATLGYARKIEELIAQRDALLEALKYHQEQTRPIQRTLDVIKAVEEGK